MYRIFITWNYYTGTLNRRQDGYLLDRNGLPEDFETLESAQAAIDTYGDGWYRMDHGEHASPTLEAVKVETELISGPLLAPEGPT